jgi:hypothetical protein
LGARDVQEATSDNIVHRFTILEKADDVVGADACALNDGVASAHARLARDIAVTGTFNVFVPGRKNISTRFIKRGFDTGGFGIPSYPALAG